MCAHNLLGFGKGDKPVPGTLDAQGVMIDTQTLYGGQLQLHTHIIQNDSPFLKSRTLGLKIDNFTRTKAVDDITCQLQMFHNFE